mgnify:CR=1 FL=1
MTVSDGDDATVSQTFTVNVTGSDDAPTLAAVVAILARDAGLLVHQAGYRCTAAGVVNMFPHTAHVESMAVFERV